jgi:hypothetical protein
MRVLRQDKGKKKNEIYTYQEEYDESIEKVQKLILHPHLSPPLSMDV